MAILHVCDRCGAVIPNYNTEEHCISIFDKNYKPEAFLHKCGIIYNNKCKPICLCEKCQEDLEYTMYLFMHRNRIK